MKNKTIHLFSGTLFIILSITYASAILLLPLPFAAKFFISVFSASAMGMGIRAASRVGAC